MYCVFMATIRAMTTYILSHDKDAAVNYDNSAGY